MIPNREPSSASGVRRAGPRRSLVFMPLSRLNATGHGMRGVDMKSALAVERNINPPHLRCRTNVTVGDQKHPRRDIRGRCSGMVRSGRSVAARLSVCRVCRSGRSRSASCCCCPKQARWFFGGVSARRLRGRVPDRDRLSQPQRTRALRRPKPRLAPTVSVPDKPLRLLQLRVHVSRYGLSYSSCRRHQKPVSLRPSGARSSHWYMPQRPSSPRAYAE
jgi:hypothetical protein